MSAYFSENTQNQYFGKISLDFLCLLCYNYLTEITKKHYKQQNGNNQFLFIVLCIVIPCKLGSIVYQTHNHRMHSNLMLDFHFSFDYDSNSPKGNHVVHWVVVSDQRLLLPFWKFMPKNGICFKHKFIIARILHTCQQKVL